MQPYHELKTNHLDYWGIKLDPAQREVLDFKLDISFMAGHSIRGIVPSPLKFTSEWSELIQHPPHFLEGDSIPVVSKLFVEALTAAGVDNYEIFPATVYCKKADRKFTDYFALNVIGVFDAIDEAKSRGDEIMGGTDEIPAFVGYHDVVFSPEKLRNEPRMFRIPQNGTMLFVHNIVCETIMRLAPPAPERWGICFKQIDVV